MFIKNIIDEDFVNYKKASMYIGFPYCTFKCEADCKMKVCQNRELMKTPNIEIDAKTIVDRYINNPITSAIVCGGLEPFDSFNDLKNLIKEFRKVTNDDIVIYSGYREEEVYEKVYEIKCNGNIIIKYGRFVPDSDHVFDEVLGIELSSKNQYAKKYTNI